MMRLSNMVAMFALPELAELPYGTVRNPQFTGAVDAASNVLCDFKAEASQTDPTWIEESTVEANPEALLYIAGIRLTFAKGGDQVTSTPENIEAAFRDVTLVREVNGQTRRVKLFDACRMPQIAGIDGNDTAAEAFSFEQEGNGPGKSFKTIYPFVVDLKTVKTCRVEIGAARANLSEGPVYVDILGFLVPRDDVTNDLAPSGDACLCSADTIVNATNHGAALNYIKPMG